MSTKKAKKQIKTMTAGEAFDKAIAKNKLVFNCFYFTMIGWKSPSDGTESGPFLVTKNGSSIIEVSQDIELKDIYSINADCYFPWIKPTRGA